jgi:hypothetical protein
MSNGVSNKKNLDELEDDNKLAQHLDELQKQVEDLLREYGPVWRYTTTSGPNVHQDVVTYAVAKALVKYVCDTTGKNAPEHVAIFIDDICTLIDENFGSDRMQRVFERGL